MILLSGFSRQCLLEGYIYPVEARMHTSRHGSLLHIVCILIPNEFPCTKQLLPGYDSAAAAVHQLSMLPVEALARLVIDIVDIIYPSTMTIKLIVICHNII